MKTVPRYFFCSCLLVVITSACATNNEPDISFTEIIWQDEFDVDGSLDPDRWTFDIGTGVEQGIPGWGNQELQYYTDRPENVRVEDGNLLITARQESFEGSSYTSARILTRGKFQNTFGRYEASIQLPWGPGIWPAFWLLGDDSNGTEIWPQIGEIDIMEYRGQEPTVIHGSVHGPGYSAGNAVTARYTLSNGRFDTDFYLFAIEWSPNSIKFFVDDVMYNEITPDDVNGEWVFNDNSFYIILNVAVGGTFVGPPSSQTPFPQTMKVNYVRVYGEPG
ncbi:MAG: glycoside hydrolase family 16 protein [Balneolaceae bacterium]|nr:MAG: glycoside hydrolase family 16 protein [Balneolaceae bacterium]